MQRKGPTAIRAAVILLSGALALLGAAQAYAGTLEAARERGTLIVGVREDYPPLGYLDRNGKHTGFEVDLARYLARQLLGTKGKLQLVPVQAGNRLTFLVSDLVDMLIAAVTDNGDRTSVYAFSDPYFTSGSLLLVPRGSPIKDILHVKGKKVAVIGGSVQQEGLEPVVPEAAQVQFSSVSEAIAALRAGRVDAFAEDDVLVLALARQYPDLVAVGKPFQPHPLAVAMRKGDGDIVAWVNEQLRKAKADGTYDRLWNKYFGNTRAILARP